MTGDGARLSRAFPIVVSGPSGVGKSTIVDRLLAGDAALRLAVSMTTRTPRSCERDGEDYFFVDRAEFEDRRRRGQFVESATVHDHSYGTPRAELDDWLAQGYDVLLDVDYQGGKAIKQAYAGAVAIFILPPSLEHLEKRLRGRKSDGEAQIQLRLEVASREMAKAVHYDFAVVNDDVEGVARLVAGVIVSERQRVEQIDAERLRAISRPAAKTESE